jgi:hypothetical protein
MHKPGFGFNGVFNVVMMAVMLTLSGAAFSQAEWVTLIDGTEGLENFDRVGDANWRAEMASVRATEGSGASWLVSKESYDNFELRVEFWASHDANSGIYMRCQNPRRITDRNCYEANIFDQRPEAAYGTGGIVHVAPVSEPLPKAGDKWNVYRIVMDDDHLIVELNNRRTVDVRDSKLSSGPFALQWARGELRLRKVQIRRL